MAIWKGKVIVMAKKNNAIVMDITVATSNLEKAVMTSTASSKAVAEILNTINERELFRECNVDSFKAWIDDTHKGDVFGIGYKQAKSLIDCFNHVWKHAELANIPCGTASALVSTCKKDSAKVVAKGTDSIVDDIAMVEKALKVVLASLEKKGKADEKARLAKAWDNIKVAVDK